MLVLQHPEEAPFLPGCRGAQCIQGFVQRMRRRRADRRAARAATASSEQPSQEKEDVLLAGSVAQICRLVAEGNPWQVQGPAGSAGGGGQFAPTDFDEDRLERSNCKGKFSMKRMRRFLKRFRKEPQAFGEDVDHLLRQVLALTDFKKEICHFALENIFTLLKRNADLRLTKDNWRPILVAALQVASKPCEDVGAWKVTFESRLQTELGLRSSAFEQLEQMMLVGLGKNAQAVLGDYIFGATIGEGSFAKVKRAARISTEEVVAVKIVDNHSSEAWEMAQIEAQILNRLHHPHIVGMHEMIETRSQTYLIMEYAVGGSLFAYVQKQQRLEEPEARRLFRQIIAGLEEVHAAKIAHRDLKLENLLLDEANNIKIADFGMSKELEPKDELITTKCGSVVYAAPEVLEGKECVPYVSDLWSCGVILFIMICGHLPFEGNSPRDVCPKIVSASYEIPWFIFPEAAGLIAGLLRKQPLSRFSIAQVRAHVWYRQLKASVRLPKVTAETRRVKTAKTGHAGHAGSSLMRNAWCLAKSRVPPSRRSKRARVCASLCDVRNY